MKWDISKMVKQISSFNFVPVLDHNKEKCNLSFIKHMTTAAIGKKKKKKQLYKKRAEKYLRKKWDW